MPAGRRAGSATPGRIDLGQSRASHVELAGLSVGTLRDSTGVFFAQLVRISDVAIIRTLLTSHFVLEVL